MSSTRPVVHWTWLGRYLNSALGFIVSICLAVWLAAVLARTDIALGIAGGLFMLEMGVGGVFLRRIGKLYHEQSIDTREMARRMWTIYVSQTAVLVVVAIVLAFGAYPILVLLPVIYLPVRMFLAVRLRREYDREEPGTYFRKGIYD